MIDKEPERLRLKTILILLFSYASLGQDAPQNTFEYTRDMYRKVGELSKIQPKEYSEKVSKFRSEIERYIEHKKGVCQGNFSTVILDSGVGEKGEYKLSKSEQELCYRELKGLQLTYINKLFEARKGYLDHLHGKRIESLNKVREDALKQLQATFNKKLSKQKRRRNDSKSRKKQKK